MPNWVHRTSKQFLKSIASADLPETQANYIEEPDLSAVVGFASTYWDISGDVISLMDQTARDAVDAVRLIATRDALANQIDRNETYARGFALLVLDEFNDVSLKINEILDAIDAGATATEIKVNISAIANRPQRTPAQLKSSLRNKLDV